MEAPNSAGPEPGERRKQDLEEGRRINVKQEPDEGPSRNWDVQLQEFLKTLQAPDSGGESPQLPWNDPQSTHLLSQKRTEGSKRPGESWISQDHLHLVGEAQQERESSQEASYSAKGQRGALSGASFRLEKQRQDFRRLCYQEAEGPREVCNHLQELCHQWLKPEKHTKDQIVDLVTLEQFLAILPSDMQSWLRENTPRTCAQAVSLAEDFLVRQQEVKGWSKQMTGMLEAESGSPPKANQALLEMVKARLSREAEQEADGEESSSGLNCGFLLQTEGEVISKRGKPKFVHGGFLYVFDTTSKADCDVKFWRCERKDRCKARLHTRGGEVIREVNTHSHDPSATQVQVAQVTTNIRKRAAETLEAPAVVINKCLAPLSQVTLASIPTTCALRKSIQRKRSSLSNPISLQELSIPDHYRVYSPQPGVEELFLLCDSGPGPERILIFGRESWLQHLVTSDTWFADGRFSISPGLFAQIYVILTEKHGGIHPVVYALLPNKRCATYVAMFRLLLGVAPTLNPSSIVCDFEQVPHQAMKELFPDVQIKGCFFHLAQNMHCHISALGLATRYRTDPEFALKAKMILALAFVPLDRLDEFLDALADVLPAELMGLMDWFEDRYVGCPNRGGIGRCAPLYPPEMWNLHRRTLSGEEPTNGHAEAAHGRLQYELGVPHPTVWKLIDDLRKVQKGWDAIYERLLAGHELPQKLKKYRDAEKRIQEALHWIESMEAVEFLRSISHSFQIKD